MTDMSSSIQRPALGATVTPSYVQCTAADKFTAFPNSKYLLYYKNAGTVTGTIFINEKLAALPGGSSAATPAGASKWSDALVSATIPVTSERAVYIDNSTPFIDSQGFINLQHTTPTTLTLCIFGPF